MFDIIFLIRKISDEDIWGSSAALAFYLLLSFFPFLIALVALMAFVPVDFNSVLLLMKHFLPENVYAILSQNIYLLEQGRTSVVSIGFISAVWIASKGVKALMRALNKSYRTFDKRPWWKRYIISVVMTVCLALGMIVSVFLYVLFSHSVMDIINFSEGVQTTFGYLRTFFMYSCMTAVVAFLFKVIPDKKLRFKDVIPGALATGIIWVLATVAFGKYIGGGVVFDNLYGTLGSVIALMVWLYLISFSVLFGNAVNSYRLESVKYE